MKPFELALQQIVKDFIVYYDMYLCSYGQKQLNYNQLSESCENNEKILLKDLTALCLL